MPPHSFSLGISHEVPIKEQRRRNRKMHLCYLSRNRGARLEDWFMLVRLSTQLCVVEFQRNYEPQSDANP